MADGGRIKSVGLEMPSTSYLIRHARLVHVLTGRMEQGDVLIRDGIIQHIGSVGAATGATEIDAQGCSLIPGLMDGHVHIESAMLHPAEFAQAAALHGTTAVFADPHEIANVLGVDGIEFMLKATEAMPLDFYFTASSCVPATDMETSGAEVTADDIAQLLKHPRVVGLAEVMNFPGVIAGDPQLLRKIAVAKQAGKVVDGHAPGLRGEGLRKYVAAGVDSDHETTQLDEGLEKLSLGMWLMIREGSAAKNLEALLPAVTDETYEKCLFVSDDQTPADLTSVGHVDHILRRAVAQGLDPVRAVRMATFNTAQRFRIPHVGVIAEGSRANLVLVEDLQSFAVRTVFHAGVLVVADGKIVVDVPTYHDPRVLQTIKLPPLDVSAFALPLGGKARVIGLTRQQLLTTGLEMDAPQSHDFSRDARDVLKLAVIERHGKTRNVGLGWVHGLGLKNGALAQSVAHDHHNVIVVGANDADMLAAAKAIEEMQGGCVVVAQQTVRARLPLRIAGLMSTEPTPHVIRDFHALHAAARELGAMPEHPFAALSFLALPVIPELKLTDRGLVQYDAGEQRFRFVSVQV
jgi:adenine deaminase